MGVSSDVVSEEKVGRSKTRVRRNLSRVLRQKIKSGKEARYHSIHFLLDQADWMEKGLTWGIVCEGLEVAVKEVKKQGLGVDSSSSRVRWSSRRRTQRPAKERAARVCKHVSLRRLRPSRAWPSFRFVRLVRKEHRQTRESSSARRISSGR